MRNYAVGNAHSNDLDLVGNAVRLEVEANCPKDFLELLLRFFNLSEADAYKLDTIPDLLRHHGIVAGLNDVIGSDIGRLFRDSAFRARAHDYRSGGNVPTG